MKNYFNQIRHDALALLPVEFLPKTVLDVGCGEGNTAAYLKEKFGAEVTGIEINAEAAAVARKKLDHLLQGPVEKAYELPKNHFDLILCLDVLEHLVDPWAVLKRLAGCLKPEGYLLISLPNIQNWRVLIDLAFGRWDYTDSGLMDRTHLRFFTERTAKEMISAASLRIIRFRRSMGSEVKLFNLLTLGLFRSFLTYHLYFLAQPAKQ
ncbi:MAG: class I SAM-dependent methyltransferase [candidate division KSB1 bacterium]|nr:class I SAM-dependent methyltransferase [candidate division KSB1 bacterium]